MITIQANLIPAGRLLASRRRVHLRRWTGTCVVYATVLAAVSGLCYAAWAGESDNPAEALPATVREIDQTKRKSERLQYALAAAQVTLAANRSVGNQPDWSILLTAMAADMGEEIVLRHCQLDPVDDGAVAKDKTPRTPAPGEDLIGAGQREYVLAVTGYGRSQPAVTQFVLRLEANELFDEVKLIRATREPLLARSAVAFRLECRLGSEANAEGK